MDKTEKILFILICAIAILLRGLPELLSHFPVGGGAATYIEYTKLYVNQNLAIRPIDTFHNAQPFSLQVSPLFFQVLAAIFILTHIPLTALMKIIPTILYCATAILVYLLASALYNNRKTGLLASFFWAANYFNLGIPVSWSLHAYNFGMFLLLACFYYVCKLPSDRIDIKRILFLILLFCGAIMAHEFSLYFLVTVVGTYIIAEIVKSGLTPRNKSVIISFLLSIGLMSWYFINVYLVRTYWAGPQGIYISLPLLLSFLKFRVLALTVGILFLVVFLILAKKIPGKELLPATWLFWILVLIYLYFQIWEPLVEVRMYFQIIRFIVIIPYPLSIIGADVFINLLNRAEKILHQFPIRAIVKGISISFVATLLIVPSALMAVGYGFPPFLAPKASIKDYEYDAIAWFAKNTPRSYSIATEERLVSWAIVLTERTTFDLYLFENVSDPSFIAKYALNKSYIPCFLISDLTPMFYYNFTKDDFAKDVRFVRIYNWAQNQNYVYIYKYVGS
ncbi:MAG: hypothetical protein HY929_08765 [Euryarchaeota archaeon]|nr:hypothetical protein [Euryarchaeota archaeon]